MKFPVNKKVVFLKFNGKIEVSEAILMKKHFPGKEVYEKEMEHLRQQHREWKGNMKAKGAPFFMLYKVFQDEHLSDISGGALKLYIYLGFQANNFTGESWHSVETISTYFGNDTRTVQKWFQELEERNLVKRIQRGYKWTANTFMIPYGEEIEVNDPAQKE